MKDHGLKAGLPIKAIHTGTHDGLNEKSKKRAMKNTFIPIKAKPRQILQQSFFRLLSGPLQVRVFNSQNKFPSFGPGYAHSQTYIPNDNPIFSNTYNPKINNYFFLFLFFKYEPGKEVIEESSSCATNMEVPGRGRSKANANLACHVLRRTGNGGRGD